MTTRLRIVASLLAVTVVSTAHAQSNRFDAIAPKGSALVLFARNAKVVVDGIDASPIGRFFASPELAPLVAPVQEESKKAQSKQLREMGIDADSIPWPGPVGLAVFVEHNEELDAPELGALVWADYEDRADEAAKVLDGLVRHLEKDSGRPFETVEVAGGLRATRIEFSEDVPAGGGSDPQPPRRGRPGGFDALAEFASVPEAAYIVRQGSQFFLATSVPVLEEAMAASAGQGGASIAGSDDYVGVMGLAGSPDIALVLIPEPLEKLAEPLFAGPMSSAKVVVSKLFGGIRALALFGSVSESDAPIAFGSAIFAPGVRTGVLELLTESSVIEPPLPALGERAVTYQRINVRFAKILELIEAVIAGLPDTEADAIEGMIAPFQAGLQQGLSSLGPAVYSVTEPSRGDGTPARSMTAMKCSNEKVANALLATMLPQAGMMPRDFKGQVVYGGDGMPIEFGLGGGAMLIGTPEAVEQGLRAAADPGAKSLADDAVYQHCQKAIPDGPVCAWGYMDVATMLAEDLEARRKSETSTRPEQDDGDLEAFGVAVPPLPYDGLFETALEKIDEPLIARYFGPVVWDVRENARGLVMKGAWLRPRSPH